MVKNFSGSFRDALAVEGFVRHGDGVIIHGDVVSCFAKASVMRELAQVTFGLWFHDLGVGQDIPSQYNHFHYYDGVDRFLGLNFSLPRATYLKSKDDLMAEKQRILELSPEIAGGLKSLTDINNLVNIYDQGRLGGLMLKATREFLEHKRLERVR